MKISWFFISFFLLLFSCTKEKKQSSNHLNYPIQSEISTFDHALCSNETCNRVISQVHETLLEYNYLKRPYELQPLLAKELPKISHNGLRYTFKIKKNILYHDSPAWEGKKRFLKAQDFINQIKRLAYIPTQAKGWWLFDHKIKGLDQFRQTVKTLKDFYQTKVEGLTAPDDHTLVIDLIKPSPQFIYAFAMNFTAPTPLELIKKYDNNLRDKPIGTGPFTLKKWRPSSMAYLEKNPHYHPSYDPQTKEPLPFLDSIKFKIIKEAPTRWLNFASGKLDILELDKDDYELAFNSQGQLKDELTTMGIQRTLASSLTYWWVSFNMKHPILGNNLNLRKAIAYAINRDKFIELFTNNMGLKANSIYPPGITGHQNKNWPIQYDLNKAKEYLAKAGYPHGKGLPSFNFDLRNSSTKRRQMGEFYRSSLEKIGIKLNVIPNTFPGYLKKARKGELEIWHDGWIMDYPDPENSLQLLASKNKAPGPNVTSYDNSNFDQDLIKLQESSNLKSQKSLLKKMESNIRTNLPWHMMYYARYNILFHKHIKNYQYSDVVNNFFKYLKKTP